MKKIILITLVVLSSIVYVGSFIFSFSIYHHINFPNSSFSLGVFQGDTVYGHTLKEENLGYYYFSNNTNIKIYSNKNKDRTYLNNPCDSKKSSLLFLGDSFTFGDGVIAEETFPFIVQEKSNNCIRNMSKSGYSYAHYLLQLKETVPTISIDSTTLFIQLSPWLEGRSINRNMASILNMQVPFFAKEADETFVSLPIFSSGLFEYINTEEMNAKYRTNKFELKKFFQLHNELGKKIYWSNIFNETTHFTKSIRVRYPKQEEVLPFFFDQISANYSTLNIVFLNIGYDTEKFEKIMTTPNLNSYEFLDLESVLINKLQNEKEYFSEYAHWNKSKTELLDRHYNAYAHSICAITILEFLEN